MVGKPGSKSGPAMTKSGPGLANQSGTNPDQSNVRMIPGNKSGPAAILRRKISKQSWGGRFSRRLIMTNAKPTKTDRQSKEQLKGNLGQKEAQIEREKGSDLSHMERNSARPTKDRAENAAAARSTNPRLAATARSPTEASGLLALGGQL
jgi:hypothetical protein